jgi:hypothetical protein
LIAAAHLAHLAVEETVYEPLAAAYACVHPEARAREWRCSTWASSLPTW